jgi:class 3 adenylate cyclase
MVARFDHLDFEVGEDAEQVLPPAADSRVADIATFHDNQTRDGLHLIVHQGQNSIEVAPVEGDLYVGQIATSGRTEVTALGDPVNETARIEACASGGRALASKDLIERLDGGDAAALDVDPDQLTYTALADLSTATEKARRDAPAIAVCEV